MSYRAPLRKMQDLIRRFGLMEGEIAGLHEQIGELHRLSVIQQEQGHRQIESLAAALRAATEEIRDSVHLSAARGSVRRGKVRALFLVHHIEAWDSYDALVAAMSRSADFEPIVASIPRHFHGMDGFGYEEEIHRQLQERDVPHLRLAHEDGRQTLRLIKAIEPDLIFRQSQWEADIPSELATDRLTFARLCMVPYETMNIVRNVPDDVWGNTAVDSPYHRAAWVVFCTNDMVKEMAARDGSRGGAQFRVVGHPKADRLREAAPQWPLSRPGTTGRVVWSAHHTVGHGWSDFGAFHLVADDMLAWAAATPETDFVFMPHPSLLPFLRSPNSPWTVERLDEWLERWTALSNTVLFTEGDYAPVLQAADVMITDGLSMLVEPQVVQMPVIFIERDGHRPFNDIGEVVRTGVHPVSSLADARELALGFLSGRPDPLAVRQAENVERLFGRNRSVDRILETLREMISNERGEAPSTVAALSPIPRQVRLARHEAAREGGIPA